MRTLLAVLLMFAPLAARAGPLVPPRLRGEAGVVVVQDRMFGRIFGGGREERERQASDDAVRIQQLEEQVRQLTGQVETLTFTLRRMEAGSQQGGVPVVGDPGTRVTPAGPGAPPAPLGSTPSSADFASAPTGPAASPGGASRTAGPSDDFDRRVGGFEGPSSAPVDLSALNGGVQAEPPAAAPGPRNAALAEVSELQDTGRYAMAAERARQILAQGTSGAVASEARYMLGEALLAQRDFRGAANAFLETYTSDPQGVRASMSLVRLGTALNGLGEKAAACSSLKELYGAYPNLDPRVRQEAERERQAANCA